MYLVLAAVAYLVWRLCRTPSDGFKVTVSEMRLVRNLQCGCVWVDRAPTILCGYHRAHGAETLLPEVRIGRLRGRLETQRRRALRPRLTLAQILDIKEKTVALENEIMKVESEGA